MSFLEQHLQSAIAVHGTGLVLTILEGLQQSHAVRAEHTKHGLFLKLLFPTAGSLSNNDRCKHQPQTPPPGLISTMEPEIEVSPVKVTNDERVKKTPEEATSDAREHFETAEVLHLNFETYNETALSEIPTSFDEVLANARDQIAELRSNNDYDQFMDLISTSFDNFFAECVPDPKTNVDWRVSHQTYNKMSRHQLWKRVCDKHFNGTYDPLAKGDRFLQRMWSIHLLWHGDDR